MTAKLRLLLACGVLLSLGACVESDHPIADVSTSQQDPRLYGLWRQTNTDGETNYIMIGAEESEPLEAGRSAVEPGLMCYWAITQNAQTHAVPEPEGARFYCTPVGDQDFANWVTPVDEQNKGRPTTYFFVKYHVAGDRLSVWVQDLEITAAAIEAGKLKGVVQRKPKTAAIGADTIESVKITDTSENIKAFLAGGGAVSCFPDKNKIEYQKIR